MTDRVKGGMESMCAVMQKYEDIAWQKGLAEGEAKGEAQGLARGKAEERNLIRQKMLLAGIPAEQIEAVLA